MRLRAEEVECLLTVSRLHYLHAKAFQHFSKIGAGILVVVDDEDFCGVLDGKGTTLHLLNVADAKGLYKLGRYVAVSVAEWVLLAPALC